MQTLLREIRNTPLLWMLAFVPIAPLTESVNLSVKVFGESFLTDEPTRLMGAFVNRKR